MLGAYANVNNDITRVIKCFICFICPGKWHPMYPDREDFSFSLDVFGAVDI